MINRDLEIRENELAAWGEALRQLARVFRGEEVAKSGMQSIGETGKKYLPSLTNLRINALDQESFLH